MAQFSIGDSVITVDENMRGTIIKVMPIRRGRQLYTVNLPEGNRDILEVDLKIDFDESDPFERCKSGIYGSYSEYSKRNTTFKIKHSNNSTISSLKASKTLFRAYQFKPLLKFLNSPNRRLLVADEVGLGKTIEAGHIMLELKARKELNNVLIVCPKSLQEKWKAELYEKFGLTFKIIDSAKDLIADLSSKAENVKAIVNYEKIRGPKDKSKKDIKNSDKKNTIIIDYLSENPHRFSLVLCDEAHKMRNKETKTYRGAEILMSHADAVLFLTATPVMINEENLYNLLHLLDNTRYFNPQIFQNRLKENRSFIEAISELNNNIPLDQIKKRLVNASVISKFSTNEKEIYSNNRSIGEIYKEDPIFSDLITLLEGEDSPNKRAKIQYLLSSMSVMNTVFSRTRKREVTTDESQAKRCPHICKVNLHENEQEEFNSIIEEYTENSSYEDEWGEEKIKAGSELGLTQRKRQIASSIWGYLNNEEDLNKGIDAYKDCTDSKIEMLNSIIKKVFESGTRKLVVFAIFRKTLKYLSIRLKKLGYNPLIIHGEVDNRAEILEKFKHDKNIHILLSSEVGSEGLDMQFCNSMVNYDLPWNPMIVEQRIGRIDRFGQKAKVINIYNIVVADSIQEEIYMRLLDRIGIFKGTIGDMEAILDAQIDGKSQTIQEVYQKMEKEFFTKDLTRAEKEQKIAEVARAIENEKESLQHLQEGLSNTLTNDAYFRDEVNRILYSNSYVTEEELYNYLKSVIREQLSTCNLEKIDKGIMEFKIPLSQPKVVKNFLAQYCENNHETTISVNQFKTKIEDQKTFKLTFTQEIAYENRSLNYLNIYHPMIQACSNFFMKHDDESKTSFCYGLVSDKLLNKGSRYFMALYQLKTNRMVQGVEKVNVELLPVIFNLETQKIEKESMIIDRIFRRSQVEGIERNVTNDDLQLDIIEDMRCDFADYISKEKKHRLQETNKQINSDRLRNEEQTKEYYASRIQNHESNIRTWEGYLEFLHSDEKEIGRWQSAIRLARGHISTLEKERREHLESINENANLRMDDKLLSLNLITII